MLEELPVKWNNYCTSSLYLVTRWRCWLRHCATSQKVEGSIPDNVTGIFHWHNPSGRAMALGLTQPLTEVKQFHYRPWQELRVPGVCGFQILRQSAHKGAKVVSSTHRPPLLPGSIPGAHFCQMLNRSHGHSATGRIISMENSSDKIGNRSRDLAVCSTVPQPLRHRVPPTEMSARNTFWGIKAASAKGWQPNHLHVPIVLISESLDLLEPSGPVQALMGLPYFYMFILVR
jgi:hypothetical protein